MKKFFVFFTICMCAVAGFTFYQNHRTVVYRAQYPKITQIQDNVTVKGTVVENKRVNIHLASAASIDAVYVKQGDMVHKGDLLFSSTASEAESPLTIPESLLQSALSGNTAPGSKSVFPAGTSITAPIDGVIMDVHFAAGDFAGTLTPVLAISDLRDIRVVAPVGEEMIQKFRPDMPATISIDAMPELELAGQIDTILPYAVKSASILGSKDATAKTDVIFSVEQGSAAVKPGYTATINLIADVRQNTIVIPYQYIAQDSENQEYVYILGRQGRVEQRYIETGYELADYTEVVSGLTPTDVVLEPYPEIQPGDSVKVRVANENH